MSRSRPTLRSVRTRAASQAITSQRRRSRHGARTGLRCRPAHRTPDRANWADRTGQRQGALPAVAPRAGRDSKAGAPLPRAARRGVASSRSTRGRGPASPSRSEDPARPRPRASARKSRSAGGVRLRTIRTASRACPLLYREPGEQRRGQSAARSPRVARAKPGHFRVAQRPATHRNHPRHLRPLSTLAPSLMARLNRRLLRRIRLLNGGVRLPNLELSAPHGTDRAVNARSSALRTE